MTGKNGDGDTVAQDDSTLRYVRLVARYERLMEISRTLISTLEIDILLRHIVLAAAELTDTEAASILLLDPRTGTLRFEASIDPVGVSLDRFEVPLEGSIAGWIVSKNETLLIADVANEPGHFSQIDEASEFVTRNLLGVPMQAHNKVIGALEAVNKHGDEPFSDEDVNTLTTLAAQAALAIENARLFQQSDLIAEMVHELRTPLAAISATTHILNRPELPEEKRGELVGTIQSETQRLTRMTSEFLDLSRLESGRARLERRPYDVKKIVTNAAQTVEPQAHDAGLTLTITFATDEFPELVGDAEKMKQVMLNLLTNAVKYNREGGRVEVECGQVDEYVTIKVSDTGLGISQDALPHIFEKFYRVADSEGYTQGTGLGLAIAKRIVESHGGDIEVSSVAGEGTTFNITLPQPKPEPRTTTDL